MKARLILVFLLVSICGYSQVTNLLYEKSKAVLNCFETNNFAGLSKYFDDTMNKGLPANKAKEVWDLLNQQAGPYIKSTTISDTSFQGYQIVYIICIFQNSTLKMKTVFDKNEKVAGLYFVPENAPKP